MDIFLKPLVFTVPGNLCKTDLSRIARNTTLTKLPRLHEENTVEDIYVHYRSRMCGIPETECNAANCGTVCYTCALIGHVQRGTRGFFNGPAPVTLCLNLLCFFFL